MSEMTTHERMTLMYQHKNADRVPIHEIPWDSTLERWRKEGLGDADYVTELGLDPVIQIQLDNSPRLPASLIENTDDRLVVKSSWGATMKYIKSQSSIALIDAEIRTKDDWLKAKERMRFDEGRIPWDFLKGNWATWQKQGAWIRAVGWFGFDITHSWFIGTERELLALAEDPDWCVDMWQTEQDLNLVLFDRMWDAGYRFDELFWYDDMGYKLNQFFSLRTYRNLLKPIHKKAIDWAHAKGIKACLHSCGDVRPFIPDLVEMGLDGLNPLEVKAGVDPLMVKQEFGDRLLLHGGINAVLWDDIDAMEASVRENVPALMNNGGYIFASDHTTPNNVSLADFKHIVDVVQEVGRYS
jgi:uroporphyrinogen decarboxylase